jgi:SAM-dependent methyltransferase
METIFPRTVEITQCPLCGSDPASHAYFETHFGESGEDQYLICEDCSLVFQSPRLSQEDLNAFYSSQYRVLVQGSTEPIEKDLRIQHARALNLLRFVRAKIQSVSNCLDIGSSTGILLKKIKEAYGCEILGVEPGDAYRKYSKTLGVTAVESLEEIEPTLERSFSLIVMAHTLEHLPDPILYLEDLKARWLTPRGYILFEVPNLYGHDALELAHLTAFTPKTLKSTLKRVGLEVVKLQTHGRPRSLIIPLYITALARGVNNGNQTLVFHGGSQGVKFRRWIGQFWNRFATKFLTRWAWLPWPEVEI